MTRLAAAAVAAALLGLNGCGGDDSEPVEGTEAGADDSAIEATTTTVDPRVVERQAIVAAREAAYAAQVASEGPGGANPELPALYDTTVGTALEQARSWAYRELRGETGWQFPENSVSRFTVQSVTVPADQPGVAWLETCRVDDREQVVVRTGLPFWGGQPQTVQYTEEMRKDETGRWRLAESFINTAADGVAGCAFIPPVAADDEPTDEQRGAAVDARMAAEQAWLTALQDHASPVPLDSFGGYMAQWWLHSRSSFSRLVDRCPISIPERPEITRNSTDPCVIANWTGTNEATFDFRETALPLSLDSTSEVKVESVTFQQTETPEAAYLRTCRTFNIRFQDGRPVSNGRATVRGVETMHRDPADGRWKLSGRWGFAVDETAPGCG